MVKKDEFLPNTDFVADDMEKKLILMFIFEKMEIPLSDHSINEVIVSNPNWLNYIDFREALFQLISAKFVGRGKGKTDGMFYLTQSGRACLGHFYTKIPASIREEITTYAKNNRQRFKRMQEYGYDYYKNSDGTHTVFLKIKEGGNTENLLEVRIRVPTRSVAVAAASKWKDKAAVVYESIFNTLVDGE